MDILDAVDSIVSMMPAQEPITLYVRKYTDGVATDTYQSYQISQVRQMERGWAAKKMLVSEALLANADRILEVYKPILDQVGCPAPSTDDYWVDANGKGWTITLVEGSMNGNVWRCGSKDRKVSR